MQEHAPFRRTGTIVGVVAVVLAMTVAISPRAAAAGCAPFPDVRASSIHCSNIAWAKTHGVTKPIGGDYHPHEAVNRGQMATFLYRVATGGKPAPTCKTRPFPDVPTSYVHCGSIQWAKANKITKPQGVDYHPDAVVDRGQMATFLYRVATGGKPAPTCKTRPFTDVQTGYLHCGSIQWATAHRITTGLSVGHAYGAQRVVDRASMASFLHRVADLMDGRGHAAVTARSVLDSMSLAERVGELLMVGSPAGSAGAGAIHVIHGYHVGSVILTGRSNDGIAHTTAVVDALRKAAGSRTTGGTGLIVAADQEGGNVQVLQGPGFSSMPSARCLGTRYSLAQIRSHAETWGGQLAKAGVDLNLAPVMDTVSTSFAPHNAPIGYFDREFGDTADDVGARGTAFANGMQDAGVGVTDKHFPGLGRVTGNTDVDAGVTDTVTTRHSPSVGAFATGIDAGAEAVMVSTAMYAKIDPHTPAAFSKTIVTGMLRGDVGFNGAIISDSLDAKQVAGWSPGQRAVKFIEAGGDLALDTNPSTVGKMYAALLHQARSDSSFAQRIDDAALHVLRLKEQLGLLR